jgi:hypothetical protein
MHMTIYCYERCIKKLRSQLVIGYIYRHYFR